MSAPINPATPASPAPASPDRFVGHANLMAALTIISRVAGLLRDKVCSYFIGVRWEWAAFWMGFQFPNLFRRIFGEGALTAVFVPIYTEILHKQGKAAADNLASATVSLLVLVLAAVTLVGETIMIPLALSPAVSDHNRLAAAMVAIMLPYCILVCLVAIMGAIATVHEKFSAQSLSPIILNLCMALGAGLSAAAFSKPEQRVYWVAISVAVAGMLQVIQMLPTLRKSGVRLGPVVGREAWAAAGMGAILKPLLPIIIGYSAVQINVFMDTQIAWWLSPDGHNGNSSFTLFGHLFPVAMGDGAAGKLSIAQRIYLLPVGIFGVSMATAVFPPMARAASVGDLGELKRLLVTGLGKTLFLSIPSSFGMILVAKPLITLVYGGGQVTQSDIDRAYWAAIFFCIGIWAFEAQLVILRVFFVLKDTVTPTKVSIAMVLLNFTLNLTLVWFLQEGGIALATTIAAMVQGSILLFILRRRLGRLGMKSLGFSVGKSALATLIMVQVGWLLSRIKMPWEIGGTLEWREKMLTALVKLPLLVAVCGAVYIGLALFFDMKEVRDLPIIGKRLPRPRLPRL